MSNKSLQKILLVLHMYVFCLAYSQSNHLYYHKTPSPAEVGEPIRVSQILFAEHFIQSGTLYFRDVGELSFQEISMEYENGNWVGVIPGSRVTLKGIEYVTVLQKQDGGRISLPFSDDPFKTPLQIQVITNQILQKDINEKNKNTDYADADILILAPESGSFLRPEEVVISASLFNAPGIDQSQFIILIDGEDFSDQTLISDDVLSLVPEKEMESGFHYIKLIFKTKYGMDVKPIEWSFSVGKGTSSLAESFKYKGSLFAKKSENSASNIVISNQEYSTKIDAEISWLKGRYSSRSSSRESQFIQPINRESLTIQVLDYLKIENGDVYPSLSPFILDGKRVRGRYIDAGFDFGFDYGGLRILGRDFFSFDIIGRFEFQTVSGNIIRKVQYKRGVDNAYELLTDNVKYDNALNKVIYPFDRKGYTFPRKINAYRLSLSLNNKIKAGMHFFKAKDDVDEINLYDTSFVENNLFSVDTSITGDTVLQYYTLATFIDSIANGDSSAINIKTQNWDDGIPGENLALGFDLEGAMDNRKLIIQLGWNMSLTNYNIWGGIANKDSLDLLMDTISDGKLLGNYEVSAIGDFIDSYSNIFTVNPLYMNPILPIDPLVAEESSLKAFMNMPASAYYLRLKGSYVFNNILLEYRQLGPGYTSYGNPYLTNNIREFTIKDRLSLLGRRLMFVMGYQHRDNKLSDLVANPVASKTVSFNTTLAPGLGAPSIIMNIQSIGKTNGVDSINTDKYGNFLLDNRENSHALNLMASINIPGSFEKFTTASSININSITYKDNLASERNKDYFFQKAETQSISATISSRFQFPLKTTSAFNQAKIIIPYLDTNNVAKKRVDTWTSYNTSIGYNMLRYKVTIGGGIDFTTNGKSNDESINLYGLKFNSDWEIIEKLTLSINGSIRFNNTKSNKSDKKDNDGDGIIDESREDWSMNSSGINLTLGYRF